jgi:hypothetical protein
MWGKKRKKKTEIQNKKINKQKKKKKKSMWRGESTQYVTSPRKYLSMRSSF